MNEGHFQVFGGSHLAVIGMVLVVTIGWLKWLRRVGVGSTSERVLGNWVAGVLVASVALDPMVEWLRWADHGGGWVWMRVHQNAWPMQFCDFAAIFCAIGLVTRGRVMAELGYYWGLTGTLQGFLTPALEYDFPSCDFFIFFAQHGTVPMVAVVMVCGMGLRPRGGSWKLASGCGIVFLLVAGAFNAGMNAMVKGLDANYGFVCHKPGTGSILDVLGPWPWYLVRLLHIGYIAESHLRMTNREVDR